MLLEHFQFAIPNVQIQISSGFRIIQGKASKAHIGSLGAIGVVKVIVVVRWIVGIPTEILLDCFEILLALFK